MKSRADGSTIAWTCRQAARSGNWCNRSTTWRPTWRPSRSNIEASRRELGECQRAIGAAHPAYRDHPGERALGRALAGRFAQDHPRQRAACAAAAPGQDLAAAGAVAADLFPDDAVADLEHMLRKADRMGSDHQPDGHRDPAGELERRGNRRVARSPTQRRRPAAAHGLRGGHSKT